MIRLRESLYRASRHRWLGPLIVVLLALLLVMTILHGVHDTIEAGVVCVGIIVVLLSLVLPPSTLVRSIQLATTAARGPPEVWRSRATASSFSTYAFTPLRR